MPDFRALFDSHFAYVWGVLRRLGVAEADTEDLAHDVFFSVYRKLPEYDASKPIRPWLFGFAFRMASDYRNRAHRRREVLGDASSAASLSPTAEEQLAEHESSALVLKALAQIELDRRAVLVLHEWDGASIPEVADALGIPLNTAYSRLRVAREELAAAVKRMTLQGGRP